MELKDNCTICMMDMRRKSVVRLLPCGHLLYAKCSGPVIVEEKCPICRGNIEGNITTRTDCGLLRPLIREKTGAV
ncbi:PREDICTED: RING finger protein 150-like [Rhagoletis zephyria]|uniref:RING finger protein 150-like n=2 Tax=Rhagoletis zephyria TaxID=28612 RepID=UPI0008113EBC|nr:PREDICTED: RING finger protein 150-like [Rhagoletis zephyria]